MQHYGGLVVTGGAVTQALTTTGGALVAWAGTGGSNSSADSYTDQGGVGVRPDYANSRILVTPGVYQVMLVVAGTMASGADLIAQIRKNSTAVSGLKGKARVATTKGAVVVMGILEVTQADIPATIGTFADPSSSGLAGVGGAPKSMVPIDVTLAVAASTDTFTVEEASLTLVKLS